MKNCSALCAGILSALSLSWTLARAQTPADFPGVAVMTNDAGALGDGYVFMTDSYKASNFGYYVMMLTNDGTAVWYQKLTNAAFDFKVLPNGYLHYAQQYQGLTWTGGGYVAHKILDENHNEVESILAGNGYNAECHDFKMLANGHALVTSYYMTRVDMSKIVPRGNPAALVSGAVIQELDANRNVVFQWRSWDHYPFASQWVNSTAAVIAEFHVNCVFEDTDGNLIITTPQWAKKISRQTGQIMWHLGGPENQFTFVGISQAAGTNAFAGHGMNRLANGHVLLYVNGGFGPGASSTADEYALDETNKIATYIWSYRPSPAVAGPSQGSAERLPNGNTFIGWGGTVGAAPACTEVSGTNVVFQMGFTNAQTTSYRAFRSPFPSATQAASSSITDLASGDSYTFGSTGVSIDVLSGGGGYNRVTVTNEPYAPVYPLFQSKAPDVVPVRINLSEISIDSINVNVNFDVAALGIPNPTNITVYYRSTTGQGLFLPQTTSYNPVTGILTANNMSLAAQGGDLGEFIFCHPDLPDLSIPPLLAQAQNYLGVASGDVIAPPLAISNVTYNVNQQRPILLSWSPAGIAAYYEFDIDTSPSFSNPLVTVPFQNAAFYVWSNAAPNTTYYWQVRTWNDAGSSAWATGSFQTAPPSIAVTLPDGGEALRRGLSYFLLWSNNLAENVNIDLYKAGAFVSNLATNVTNTGAYKWSIPAGLTPGSDYTLKITSVVNPSLFALSAATFSIVDPPAINFTSIAPDGSVNFGCNAPGAATVTVFASSDCRTWSELVTIPVTNGVSAFTDQPAPARFYRLRVP